MFLRFVKSDVFEINEMFYKCVMLMYSLFLFPLKSHCCFVILLILSTKKSVK